MLTGRAGTTYARSVMLTGRAGTTYARSVMLTGRAGTTYARSVMLTGRAGTTYARSVMLTGRAGTTYARSVMLTGRAGTTHLFPFLLFIVVFVCCLLFLFLFYHRGAFIHIACIHPVTIYSLIPTSLHGFSPVISTAPEGTGK